MVLLIQDFEIIDLGGAGENLMFLQSEESHLDISVKKKTKQTLR